jgi:2,3-bisphosphoglycerate-independent phosphoglycerate mutase
LAKRVVNVLKTRDSVFVHIKGPDKYGHLGDARAKVREIERIDKEFIGPLLGLIDLKKVTVCVTSDHATPACVGSHSSDPVPYLITNGKVRKGHFHEGSVAKKFLEGKELLNKIISVAK